METALGEAAALAHELRKRSPDAERAAFVLCVALQLLHAVSDSNGREDIENRARHLLEEMYRTPPLAELAELYQKGTSS